MTKRVESLRAPCLDASSTLATSTSKRAISSLFFRFGGSVGQPVAARVTCLRGGCCLLSQIFVFIKCYV